jgi:hypothetical protein
MASAVRSTYRLVTEDKISGLDGTSLILGIRDAPVRFICHLTHLTTKLSTLGEARWGSQKEIESSDSKNHYPDVRRILARRK